jgi:hypothetical protein
MNPKMLQNTINEYFEKEENKVKLENKQFDLISDELTEILFIKINNKGFKWLKPTFKAEFKKVLEKYKP